MRIDLIGSGRESIQIDSNRINMPTLGTRQGGLSSPFLCNIFYHDLISILSNCGIIRLSLGGITIHNESHNVFCYADDLIIPSLSISGLQDMLMLPSRIV